jgi:hypothetical protein
MVALNINIGRKEAVFFVAFFAVTLGVGVVWASSHEAPSPGHSAGSVWIDSLGKTLEQAIIDEDFGGGFGGVYTGDSRNFNLPAGTYDITIISSYRLCNDFPVNLLFDDVVVQTVGGWGDTQGCDYNSIQKTVTSISGGIHTIGVSHPDQMQLSWIAVAQ